MNPIAALLDSNASLLVTLPLALALFTLIVLVHEFGHFWFARRFGVHVKEFALGFPPRLWSTWRGGAAHAAAPVTSIMRSVNGPLHAGAGAAPAQDPNGAIAALDADDPDLSLHAEQAAARKAAAVVLAGTAPPAHAERLAALPLPVVSVDRGVGQQLLAAAAEPPMQVRIDVGRRGAARRRPVVRVGATRFALNVIPLGGYVRMAGESGEADAPGALTSLPPWKRAVVLLAGPCMNILLVPVLFVIASLIADTVGAQVSAVVPGAPAEQAGVRVGDRLLRIGDRPMTSTVEVRRAVDVYAGREVSLVVLRDEVVHVLHAEPRANPPPGEGALGVQVQSIREPASFPLAVQNSLQRTWLALRLLPSVIVEAFRTGQGVEVSGPVGIVNTVGQAARQGPEVVFILAGFLTAQIGLFNLAPWPGLDGGRLVFVGFELLTRRRPPQHFEAVCHVVGIVLLLMLVAAITVGDVQRAVGG